MESLSWVESRKCWSFVSSFSSLCFSFAFRVFVNPGVTYILEIIRYLRALFDRYMEINSRKADVEEGEEEEEEEDPFDIEFQGTTPAEYIIKMLTLHSTQCISYLVFPILVLFVWWGEGVGLPIGSNYGIRKSGINVPTNSMCDIS